MGCCTGKCENLLSLYEILLLIYANTKMFALDTVCVFTLVNLQLQRMKVGNGKRRKLSTLKYRKYKWFFAKVVFAPTPVYTTPQPPLTYTSIVTSTSMYAVDH